MSQTEQNIQITPPTGIETKYRMMTGEEKSVLKRHDDDDEGARTKTRRVCSDRVVYAINFPSLARGCVGAKSRGGGKPHQRAVDYLSCRLCLVYLSSLEINHYFNNSFLSN